MKNSRSGSAKYATMATVALALTLAVCAPSTPVSSSSFAAASEETSQLPAAAMAEALVAPVSGQTAPLLDTPATATQPVEVSVPAPVVNTPAPAVAVPAPAAPPVAVEPVVVADPVVPAPVSPAPPVVIADPVVPAPVDPAPPVTIPPSTVAPSEPEITPITPTEPSTPHVSPDYPTIGLYTFPDGHISFLLPAGWTAQTEVIPMDFFGDGRQTVDAHIYDETGTEVALIASGVYGGVVAGPVNRTILDSQQLTDFDNQRGASHFAFFKDEYPFETPETRYFMGVVDSVFMSEGPGSASANSFLIMDNGASVARANIDVSMSAESAAAFMESEQYSKLKSLLTSMQYAE